MSVDKPRKRLRSELKDTDLLKDQTDDDIPTKKIIAEGQQGREIKDVESKEAAKKIKEQLKSVETVNVGAEVSKGKEEDRGAKQKKKKKKEKKKDKKKDKEKGDK